MEAAAIGKLAPKLYDFLEKSHKLRAELEHDIQSIKREFGMISAVIEEDEDGGGGGGGEVHSAWIQVVRDLAHDMEDCIDLFSHRVMLESDASWFRRKIHRVKTVRARNQFAKAIRRLRERSKDAAVLRERYERDAKSNKPRTNHSNSRSNVGGGSDEEEETVIAVGMGAARDELMKLTRETNWTQGQHDKLKVISLVGFGGIGKTLLARQAYDDTGEGQYQARAWVRAANNGARDVLKEILQQLGIMDSTITASSYKLRATLKDFLGTKRFFIVIDDMRTAVFWHGIKDAFPVVPGVSSRVMVTTAIQSVANACSSAHGHLYMMTTLAEEHSRELFFKEASMEDPGDRTQPATTEALTKCDGLPLALVTTAQFLQSKGGPERWANICENLGKHLEREHTLARMKRVLIHSYTSLGSQDVKNCLLYLGIYPSGHPIRRGSLIRRWLAEGIINQDHKRSALSVAVDNFDELVDRSIIQPTDASSAEVKKCRTHGMMLEFILHMSMCQDFVTLLYHKVPLPRSNVHRLSMHNRNAARAKLNPKDLRPVRSLTIFGKAPKSVLDFPKYKQLRVLDLEECDEHLGDKHLKEICINLSLLRYLSLRGAARVTILPKHIKKLQLLETLDIRGTSIEILPIEIMKLPCLIHLFGKFKLEDVGRTMGKLQTWLLENSNLETLTGFVGDTSREFTQLIGHMVHLIKVKIWCESTADASSNLSHLSEAIKEFIERGTNLTTLSLSLNFSGERAHDLLNFFLEYDNSYYLNSLKLQGNNIFSLPPFVTMLAGLTKLCLTFPHHRLSGDIGDALSKVRGLKYLKLIATQLDNFIIRQGTLGILQSLCIVVEVMTGLAIEEGALPGLDSLQLLCKDLNGFSSETIQSLPLLKVIALHDELSDQIKQDWTTTANNHPRRPKVLFKLMASEPAAGTSTAAITTGTLAQEVPVESKPAKHSKRPVAPPTDMILSKTTPSGAISTEESGSEPAAEIPVTPTTDMPLSVTMLPGAISTGEPVQVVTPEMGSESAAEISPAATTTDTMTEVVAVESEHLENSESYAAPPTYMTLSVTIPPKAISDGKFVPVATSEMGSETVAKIPAGPATSTTLSVNHNTFANAQQEHPVKVVAFEMGSEPVAEIPMALSTTDNATSVNHDAFANAQQEHPVQVDGDGQHDEHETEDIDNNDDPNDFASEDGPSTNMARFTEMEGVICLEGQQMENGTQAGEGQEMPEHGDACVLEATLGQMLSAQARPGMEMLEKAKVMPEEGAGIDVVEAK